MVFACIYQKYFVPLQYRNKDSNNNSALDITVKSTTMTQKNLKASKKMQATIARMEKKWGKLNKDYFVETIESNRVGRGFYDGCTLTCDILKNLHIVVAYDGTYYQM